MLSDVPLAAVEDALVGRVDVVVVDGVAEAVVLSFNDASEVALLHNLPAVRGSGVTLPLVVPLFPCHVVYSSGYLRRPSSLSSLSLMRLSSSCWLFSFPFSMISIVCPFQTSAKVNINSRKTQINL